MQTEQNQVHEEIMFNENRDLDAEQSFKQLCADTLKSRNEAPEHIVHLAERVIRVNELREKWGFTSQDNRQAYYKRRDQSTPQQTMAKQKKLQAKAELVSNVISLHAGA